MNRDHRQYEPIAPIGKGNFSRVVSARHIPTGEIYAVKVMTHSIAFYFFSTFSRQNLENSQRDPYP